MSKNNLKKKRESGPFNFSPLQYTQNSLKICKCSWKAVELISSSGTSLMKVCKRKLKNLQKGCSRTNSFSFTWPYIVDPFSCTVYLFLIHCAICRAGYCSILSLFNPTIHQKVGRDNQWINNYTAKREKAGDLYFVTIHSQSKRRVMLVSG